MFKEQAKADKCDAASHRVAQSISFGLSEAVRAGQLKRVAELRRKYGVNKGARLLFEEDINGLLALRASSSEEVFKLQGIGGAFPLEEALEEERRQARLREDNQ